MKETKRFDIAIYGTVILIFLIAAIFLPVGLYGDSEQFISMHVHREPMYPMWINFFRWLVGENNYLKVVSIAQNFLNAGAIIAVLCFLKKEFAIGYPGQVGSIFILLLPHILTPLFSQTHLVISCGILNEAIAFPLFLLYVLECLRYLYYGKISNAAGSFLLAMLLSLTRGQMMITLIAWGIVVGGRMIYYKKYKGIALVLTIVIVSFPVRGLIHKTYNYIVNDAYVGAVCGNVNLVTNILYVSDRDAGDNIQNPVARELFYQIYDAVDDQKLLYRYAGEGLYERARHLERSHDVIKFDYILEISNAYYYENIGTDYLERNIWVDELCADMVRGIWKQCFGRWLGNYFLLAYNGLCRSIGIVHPGINIVIGILFLLAIGLVLRCLFQKRNYKECLMMLLTGILIFGNVFATSLLIMCLSRYMIYGFSFFYIALWLLLKAEWNLYLQRKEEKNGVQESEI